MSIYSNVESGTQSFKSRFHKSISYTKHYDCDFGQLIPVLEKFVIGGDVWRIGGECLVRFLPMVSPSFTPNKFKVRYFFVPLRLIEPNTELIITGSKEGHLYNGTLPEFKNFVADIDKQNFPNGYKVKKHGLCDYFGFPVGDYESIKNDKCLPAQYWLKAYYRILWDYYLDENISMVRQNFADFESFWDYQKKDLANKDPYTVEIPKDYFTSSLPWQLKGVAPVLNVTGTGTMKMTLPGFFDYPMVSTTSEYPIKYQENANTNMHRVVVDSPNNSDIYNANLEIANKFQNISNVQLQGLGFNADELRAMLAQTRIFERLARTGSRYTEYLKANFGIAPDDGTLQRAQYLGGWSLPIVTTEVLQTAEDGSNPVGTMRGHGITRGGQKIQTFFAKEFGIIIGIAHILPKIQYTQGIKRELTYKSRFDFFNPSFQHLSEQEVRNGELYISFTDGLNDETFGFQAYGNELRTSNDLVVGDLRSSLQYWNQSISFNSRPSLNNAFIDSYSYSSNFNQSFVQNSPHSCNCLIDFYNDLDVYRPMVKYSTPGLVDHL